MENTAKFELATLGGGCFWCLEAVFNRLRGVEAVVSGYCGGSKLDATYHAVCEGNTGHAEVVQVKFDPAQISYREVLEVFFATHDPTTLNRQGYNSGTQYRSAIFAHSAKQALAAEEVLATLNATDVYAHPIVTEVVPITSFYPAEDYHQGYFANNRHQPYCQTVVAPKLAKFFMNFSDRIK